MMESEVNGLRLALKEIIKSIDCAKFMSVVGGVARSAILRIREVQLEN